jgi:effector-binding domain-containing protein
VHAAVPVAAVPADPNGLTVADLPAAETAATLIHRGSMDMVLPAWQAMARWIDANGYRSAGPPRELYLECPEDPGQWVTELQEPIVRGDEAAGGNDERGTPSQERTPS